MVAQSPKIRLVKTASVHRVRSNAKVSFKLVLRNQGAGTAHEITLCDHLPNGLAFVSARGAHFAQGMACWSVAIVRPGATRTLAVTVRTYRVQRLTRVCNRASASGSGVRSLRGLRTLRATACISILPARGKAGGVTG